MELFDKLKQEYSIAYSNLHCNHGFEDNYVLWKHVLSDSVNSPDYANLSRIPQYISTVFYTMELQNVATNTATYTSMMSWAADWETAMYWFQQGAQSPNMWLDTVAFNILLLTIFYIYIINKTVLHSATLQKYRNDHSHLCYEQRSDRNDHSPFTIFISEL